MKKFLIASAVALVSMTSFAIAGGGHHGGGAMSELDIDIAQSLNAGQSAANIAVAKKIDDSVQEITNAGLVTNIDLKNAEQDNIDIDIDQHANIGQSGFNGVLAKNLKDSVQSVTNIGASASIDF